MKKSLLLIAVVLALVLDCGAATVYFPLTNFSGAPFNRQINVRLRSQGTFSSVNPVFGTPRTLQPIGGVVTNPFLSAVYLVDIDQIAKTFVMPVPDSTNTYNAWDLINAGMTMDGPWPGLAGGTNTVLTTNYVGGFPVITINNSATVIGGSGTGNVTGPNSSTIGEVAVYSTTDGSGLGNSSIPFGNIVLLAWMQATNSAFQSYLQASNAVFQSEFQATNSAVKSWLQSSNAAIQTQLQTSNTTYQTQFAGKQDHTANLDLWSATTPSLFQSHSANLDFWSGVSGVDGTTIQDIGGVLSAATGGGGNVTGTGSSVSGNFPQFNNTSSTGIGDSGKNPSSFDVAGAAVAVTNNSILWRNDNWALITNSQNSVSISNRTVHTVVATFQTNGDFAMGDNQYLTKSVNFLGTGLNNPGSSFVVMNGSGGIGKDASYFSSGPGLGGSMFYLGAGVSIGTNNIPSHSRFDVWGDAWFTGGITASNLSVDQWLITTNPANHTLVVTNATMGAYVYFLTNGTMQIGGKQVATTNQFLDGSGLGANAHMKTGPTTNIVSSEDFAGYTNSVSGTNYNAGTNILATFDGNLHSGVITNGPNVYFTWALAGNGGGSWSWQVKTNVNLVVPYQFAKFLAGSNSANGTTFVITNGVFTVTAYGGTNAGQLEPAIVEHQ